MGRRKQSRANSRKSQGEDMRFPETSVDAGTPSAPAEVFFAVKNNPFEQLEEAPESPVAETAPAPVPQESPLLSSLSSELKALEDKLARKRAKIHTLKSNRDALKTKVDTGYEQIKQLKNSQNKAKSLEEHNRLLQAKNSSLQKEKESLEEQVAEMDREAAALVSMQRELDFLTGSGLDTLSLEQCQQLLTTSTEALVKIEDALKKKTEEMLCSKRCLECQSRPRGVLILPCGHFAVCEVCADSAKACPACSSPVVSRVKVHSS